MILRIFSEFIPNNIDTSRVTTKRFCKIILFWNFLTNKTDIFRELLPNTTDLFPRICIGQYLFLSQMWAYSKSLLTGLKCKEYLQKSFLFQKVNKESHWFYVSATKLCNVTQVKYKNVKFQLLLVRHYHTSYLNVFIKRLNLLHLCHWFFPRKFINFSEAATGSVLNCWKLQTCNFI